MTSRRIFVAAPFVGAVMDRARREFEAVVSETGTLSAAEVIAALHGRPAEGVVISGRTKFDAAAIDALPDSVRVLATVSVGYDHIDIRAAAKRGLIVTNTPDVLTDATADLTLMLMLGACLRMNEYAAIMRAGWRKSYEPHEMLGRQVSGSRLGILGMGRIGRAVATRARGFGMDILYHGPRRLPADLEQDATYCRSFEEMLPRCDILSLHAPSGPKTDNILDSRTIALLPKGAVVVNAARGRLIDEAALIGALQSGHLGGAGLDVFLNEPAFDLRFLDMPNVFMTPHMGSATLETRTAMGYRALDNVDAVLSARPPLDPVVPG